jgi:predicted ATP-grasp superfamily ATP-dependent carboligase
MATADSQRRWRRKHRLIKRQLNVMARESVHRSLDNVASTFNLRGKGEAVTFASYVMRGLIQRADHDGETAQMLRDLSEAYHRDRDINGN